MMADRFSVMEVASLRMTSCRAGWIRAMPQKSFKYSSWAVATVYPRRQHLILPAAWKGPAAPWT